MLMFFKKETSPTNSQATPNTSPQEMPQSQLQDDSSQDLATQKQPISSMQQSATRSGSLVVEEGVRLEGSLNIPDMATVSGLIEGNLTAHALFVQKTGEIFGQVNCQLADIAGHIESHLQVHDFLTLRSTAIITGDVFYKEIAIEKGARITGKFTRL
jgi:cytoskeletal protein CcmA (bactofilin family)